MAVELTDQQIVAGLAASNACDSTFEFGDGSTAVEREAAHIAAFRAGAHGASVAQPRVIPDEQIDAIARSLGISYGGREFDIRSIARAVACAGPVGDVRRDQDVGAVLPAHTGPTDRRIYVVCHQCDNCQHIGINDEHPTESACNRSACGWHGPSPTADHCPGCGQDGTMSSACPKCGGLYVLLADADVVPDGVPALAPALPLDRAADFLEQYADFIRRDVMSVDIERHPYLPELEEVASEIRAALGVVVDRDQ